MKKILLTLLGLVMVTSLWADDISLPQAQQIAAGYFDEASPLQGGAKRAAAVLQPVYRTEADEIYVFNNPDGNGWVIVAGEDRARKTILAYSHTGSFDYETAPDGAKMLLEQYADGISKLRKNGLPEVKQSRRAPQGEIKPFVEPLLKTSWHQRAPYNNLVPEGPAGCVATAITQIMNYWQWPKQGSGQHTNSRSDAHETRDFSQSIYDWENILDDYIEGEYNDTQAYAVALLTADFGTATDMNYSPYGSGAYSTDAYKALIRYFGYDEASMRYAIRYGFDTGVYSYYDEYPEEWDNLLKQELSAGRPVYYAGAHHPLAANGHAFVCDGYDKWGYFSFNFGWGGSSSYYTTSSVSGYSYFQEIIAGILPRTKEPFVVDGLYYSLSDDDGEAQLISSMGTNYTGDITIPASISHGGKDYRVTSISQFALAYKDDITSINFESPYIKEIPSQMFGKFSQLKSVTLNDNIETIGESAFYNCPKLEQVNMGNGVKSIGRYAFRETALKEITLSSHLETIGNGAFAYNTSLKAVHFNDQLKSIGIGAFAGDVELEDINLESLVNLTTIPEYAFNDCNALVLLELPASIKYIGERAFSDCDKLSGVYFDDKASGFILDQYAFNGRGAYFKGLERAAEIRSYAVRVDMTTFVVQPTCKYGVQAIAGNIDQLILPKELQTFNVLSWGGVQSYEVEAGNAHYSSRSGALYDKAGKTLMAYPSSSETWMKIPAGVETIAEDALQHASTTHLTLPASLKHFDGAFKNMGIQDVTCQATTPPVISENTFGVGFFAYGGKKLYVPYGTKALYQQAEVWKNFVIEDDAVAVQGKYCYKIAPTYDGTTYYAILDGRNAEVAFDGNANDIPESIQVGEKTYPVQEIYSYAFRGDLQLRSITLPASVGYIYQNAFLECSNLQTINLGKGVYDIGYNPYSNEDIPFRGCPSLCTINVDDQNERFYSIDGVLFAKEYQWEQTRKLLYCPPMQLYNGRAAARKTYTIPDGTLRLGRKAFCNTLKHVVIPASIEEFASYDEAFILCTKLQTVTNLATTPQNSTDIFNGDIHWAYEHTPCVLQVPQGSKAAYESQWPWNLFKKIVEINPANFNPEGGANDDPDPDDTSDGTYTSLIILFKDQTTQTFELEDMPVITVEGLDLKVATNNADVTIPLKDIVRYYFKVNSITGIDEVNTDQESLDYKNGILVMHGLKAGSVVSIYSLDGKLQQSITVPRDGFYRRSLASLQSGVYIVKANSLSYKIMKR